MDGENRARHGTSMSHCQVSRRCYWCHYQYYDCYLDGDDNDDGAGQYQC